MASCAQYRRFRKEIWSPWTGGKNNVICFQLLCSLRLHWLIADGLDCCVILRIIDLRGGSKDQINTSSFCLSGQKVCVEIRMHLASVGRIAQLVGTSKASRIYPVWHVVWIRERIRCGRSGLVRAFTPRFAVQGVGSAITPVLGAVMLSRQFSVELETEGGETCWRRPAGKTTPSFARRTASNFGGLKERYQVSLGIVFGMTRQEICRAAANGASTYDLREGSAVELSSGRIGRRKGTTTYNDNSQNCALIHS